MKRWLTSTLILEGYRRASRLGKYYVGPVDTGVLREGSQTCVNVYDIIEMCAPAAPPIMLRIRTRSLNLTLNPNPNPRTHPNPNPIFNRNRNKVFERKQNRTIYN